MLESRVDPGIEVGSRHWTARRPWDPLLKSKMADEDEVEIRGIKRPLVENYSDDDEEEEARRKEGSH